MGSGVSAVPSPPLEAAGLQNGTKSAVGYCAPPEDLIQRAIETGNVIPCQNHGCYAFEKYHRNVLGAGRGFVGPEAYYDWVETGRRATEAFSSWSELDIHEGKTQDDEEICFADLKPALLKLREEMETGYERAFEKARRSGFDRHVAFLEDEHDIEYLKGVSGVFASFSKKQHSYQYHSPYEELRDSCSNLYKSAVGALPTLWLVADGLVDYSFGGLIGKTEGRNASRPKAMWNLKCAMRIFSKAKRDEEHGYCGVQDIARASVVFASCGQLVKALCGLLHVEGFPESGSVARKHGASVTDFLINMRMPNGHICELQLHLKEVFESKKGGHDAYGWLRLLKMGEAEDRYEGALDDDGRKHGFGRMCYASGARYEGEWLDDKRHGEGTRTYMGGEVYEGSWKVGMKDGWGKLTGVAGDVYEGNYVRNQREGHGTMAYASGNVYEGEWKDGKRHGEGKITWKAPTMEYEGERVYSTGGAIAANANTVRSWKGQWEDNRMQGLGFGEYWISGETAEMLAPDVTKDVSSEKTPLSFHDGDTNQYAIDIREKPTCHHYDCYSVEPKLSVPDQLVRSELEFLVKWEEDGVDGSFASLLSPIELRRMLLLNLKPRIERRLDELGMTWKHAMPGLEAMRMEEIHGEDLDAILAMAIPESLVSRAALLAKLRPKLEPELEAHGVAEWDEHALLKACSLEDLREGSLDSLLAGILGPKMRSALLFKVRPLLEPELPTSWENALPILLTMKLSDLQGGVRAIADTISEMRASNRWTLLCKLRPYVLPRLASYGLLWDDLLPVLEASTIDEILACLLLPLGRYHDEVIAKITKPSHRPAVVAEAFRQLRLLEDYCIAEEDAYPTLEALSFPELMEIFFVLRDAQSARLVTMDEAVRAKREKIAGSAKITAILTDIVGSSEALKKRRSLGSLKAFMESELTSTFGMDWKLDALPLLEAMELEDLEVSITYRLTKAVRFVRAKMDKFMLPKEWVLGKLPFGACQWDLGKRGSNQQRHAGSGSERLVYLCTADGGREIVAPYT